MSTTTPKRQQLIEALCTRLEAITISGGYRTDAGQHVYLNEEPPWSDSDPDLAVVVAVGEDQPGFQRKKFAIQLPIEVHALARADLDAPYLMIETLLGDIKEAIELDDRTVGGLVDHQFDRGATRVLEREEGSESVGVAIGYVFPYFESWGAP